MVLCLLSDLYGDAAGGPSSEMGNLLKLLQRDDARRDDLYNVFVDFESKYFLSNL